MSCDLLSFFDFLIFTTIFGHWFCFNIQLWFAFVLWFSDIYNNLCRIFAWLFCVVICFRSLIFWYLQQLKYGFVGQGEGCDLLSFFDFLIFTTIYQALKVLPSPLWFAFVLWFSDIYNNKNMGYIWDVEVVICFRSLIFWYLQQLMILCLICHRCCDLLSFFDFLIFTTIPII